MKRKRTGSITVLALLIMVVILMSAMYLVYLTKLQSLISSASNNKIQSLYLAEAKINKVFYNDKYYKNQIIPSIIKFLNAPYGKDNKIATINIDSCDMDLDDQLNSIDAKFYKNDDNKYIFELLSKSIYNGVETKVKAYGPIIKNIFEADSIRESPLLSYDLDVKSCYELEKLMQEIEDNISIENLPSTIKGIKTFDHETILVKFLKNTSATHTSTIIKLLRNGSQTSETEIKDGVFLLIKNNINTPIELLIEESDPNKTIKLKGIIYLEGDLVISSSFQFSGILILKGGTIIINTDTKPVFKGIILTDGEIDFMYNIELEYSYEDMCKYGVFMPGFLDSKLEVIKKY